MNHQLIAVKSLTQNGFYLKLLTRVISTLTSEFKPDKKFQGGVLVVNIPSPTGAFHTAIVLGDPGENIVDYAFFANEKARRLQKRRQTTEGKEEFASSQSANPDREQYGGCILGKTDDRTEVFFSFSGAPALVDEAVMYFMAEKKGLAVPKDYDNPLVQRARELFRP
ncbi:MAG: hypothetical protein QG585_41 [Patescibacteria group bacterium]|nr:hypothetical protein [Patescibacteria group bacterium]